MAFRPARFLAPLALLGTIGAVLLVISSSNGGSKSDAGSRTNGSITGSATTSPKTTTAKTSKRYYVVKEGDVLSGIAASTGIPLARIEQLNPKVDAQTLHAGQKIKLAP
ncbi:MAG: hypothetical protein QOG68_343 [Solirubrobacteraceae bacterium]|jgi:LysM repeat protein|nr:hypothetical protein [Solirubrobacteraceae bacterium]